MEILSLVPLSSTSSPPPLSSHSPSTGFFRFSRHLPSSLRIPSSSSRINAAGGDDEKRLFVFGTGFVGRYVSTRLRQEKHESWDIYGTSTSTDKAGELEAMGVKAHVFKATENRLEQLNSLQHATHILVSIPPIPSYGDPLLVMLEDLRDILRTGNLRWLCYLSSTSVYGDCQGALVDEDYPANPTSDSAKGRLVAEKGWLDLGRDLDVPSYVFRLGGTYGPGRSALETVMRGKSLTPYQRMRESKRYTARVHVADIYQAITASFCASASGIFNVVDDDPTPRSEVFAFARDLILKKFPGRIEEDASHNLVHKADNEVTKKDEKRVSNARLKKELGVNLIYPTYKEGLMSILESIK